MSSTGDVWIKVRFRRFRLIGIDTHLWSEYDKQVRSGGGKTRSSHSLHHRLVVTTRSMR